MEAEKKKIKEVWERAKDALANCDWESYSTVWAHEPTIEAIHSAQASWWTGWEEIGSRYKKIIEKGKPIHGQTNRMNIHLGQSKDVAWVTTESELCYGSEGRRIAWQVIVFQKFDGIWKIVLAFDAPKKGKGYRLMPPATQY